MNGFAAGLTNCVTRDGQSPPSADLPMGGKKLVNLGLATVGTDALSQNAGDARYILASGVVNFTLTGALTAATGAFSGNVTIGGTLGVTGATTLAATTVSMLTITSAVNQLQFLNGSAATKAYIGTQGSFGSAGTDDLRIRSDSSNIVIGFVGTETARFTSAGAFIITGTLNVSGAVTLTTPLAVASGGTGATSSTGSGSLVLSANPALTGTPTAPTAAVGTNTTQLATTAFVQAARPPIGQTITSSATVTPTFNDDFVEITAQAAGLTLANPTGTAVNMWGIAVRVKDNATPQTLAFGTQYRGVGVTLPTTTVAGKTLVLGMIFNNASPSGTL
jgi:hypothetical protein